MEPLGRLALFTFKQKLGRVAVIRATSQVFGTFAGVLVGAIILTLIVNFIRKILNGANKGKARIR